MDIAFAFPTHQLPLWVFIMASSLALIWLALRILENYRGERINQFVHGTLAPRLQAGADGRARKPLRWFTLAGCAFLAIALAQPHWGESRVDVQRRSRDILVILDISPSMLAEDAPPTRLEMARRKALMLMDRFPGDRFGFIVISGGAERLSPLSHDHGYARAVLRSIDSGIIGFAGTDLEAGLNKAAETFQAEAEHTGPHSRHSRAVVVLSDGEEVSGDVVDAARDLSELAAVYALGIGTTRGVAVEAPPWLRRDLPLSAPGTHHTRLEEDGLIQAANAGGGSYIRGSHDSWDLDQLESGLTGHATRVLSDEQRIEEVNRYQWPLGLGLLCFAAEGFWLVLLPAFRQRNLAREHAAPDSGNEYA
ncbi:MAG: VWA domain-containing protein [Candidatus Hydrogenedentota bacterium]